MKAFVPALLLAGAALPAFAASPLDPNMIKPFPPVAACAALWSRVAAHEQPRFMRLDELPPGLVEHAVLRSVAGCPVREVIYRGQTVYVTPASPPILNAQPAHREPLR